MFADFLNRISSLTFRKIINILIVQLSYGLSVLLKKPLVWGRPFFISIEPTVVCNLACPQCPTGTGDVKRAKKYLDPDTFRNILNDIAGTTAILSLYHQGEPLMHKSFLELVGMARERNIYTVTSTNGQLLTEDVCRGLGEAGLDRIIVSLDGTDEESYQKYRAGGDFQKITSGIRFLSESKKANGKPYIILQFLVFKHNQHQVTGIREFGKNLGADLVRIKTAQLEYPETAGDYLPDQNRYSRYRKNNSGEWKLAGTLKNRCRRLWQTTVITSDGLVVPCCFDKLASYPMGSVSAGTLNQIWKNQAYNDFRRKILRSRETTAICTNCTEGLGRIYC